ncbi:MAG: hypothetical protein Q9222_002697 [Ikaeria aurantiellina]
MASTDDAVPVQRLSHFSVGPDLDFDPIWNAREKRCEEIFGLLEDVKVVQLAATHSSGKTILATAFVNYVNKGHKKHGKVAVYQNARSLRRDSQGNDTPVNRLSVKDWLSEDLSIPHRHIGPSDHASDIIIVIDEGHFTYADESFWEDMQRTTGDKKCTSFFILSSWNESLVYRRGVVPIELHPKQCIGFLPSQGASPTNYQHLGICYDEDEFEMTVNIFESKALPADENFKLSKEARQLVFEVTKGHPGATAGFLYALKDQWTETAIFGIRYLPITYAQATIISEDREAICNYLSTINRDVGRGFFPLSDLKQIAAIFFNSDRGFEAISSCLQRVILTGAIEKRIGEWSRKVSAHDRAVEVLHRVGVLQASLSSPVPHSVVYFLPTLLHARHYEHLVFNQYPVPTRKQKSLKWLLMGCMSTFKGEVLIIEDNDQCKYGPTGTIQPFKALFQSALHRALRMILKSPHIQADWNGPGPARIDFRVMVRVEVNNPYDDDEQHDETQYWGIQTVRDGEGIDAVVNELKPNGKYRQWLEYGHLTRFALVDFRKTRPNITDGHHAPA